MNRKFKLPIILFLLVLFFVVLYFSMSFSKSLVIRRTIFLHGHPVTALTTPIQNKPNYKDNKYGDCYFINNRKLNGTENTIPGVCMKNKYGFFYKVTIGVY